MDDIVPIFDGLFVVDADDDAAITAANDEDEDNGKEEKEFKRPFFPLVRNLTL